MAKKVKIRQATKRKGVNVDEKQVASGVEGALAAAEQETNTEPTKAQKGAAVSTGHVKGKTDGKGKTKPLRSSLMASSRCGRS